MASQRLSRDGSGVRSPGPAAGGDHRAAGGTRSVEPPTRARPRAGLQSRLSGLRGRGDGQPARHAAMGGRSDLAGRRRTSRRDGIYGAIAYTAGALAHQQRGDHTEAARQLENVRRLRRLLRGAPWLNADLALRCADISLDLGDLAGALECAQVAGDALQGYPDAGTLPARLQRLETSGSGAGRTTGSPRPSSGSSLSCRRISRSRRSPIGSTSHAIPSRHRSRRSTTSSASRADPKQSRSSSRPASDRRKPRSRSRIQISTEAANPCRIAPGLKRATNISLFGRCHIDPPGRSVNGNDRSPKPSFPGRECTRRRI